MQSDLFTLDWKDFLRGAIAAVIAGVLFAVYGILHSVGFDVYAADWFMITHLAVNGAFAGFIGYVGKRFISDDSGNTLGSSKL